MEALAEIKLTQLDQVRQCNSIRLELGIDSWQGHKTLNDMIRRFCHPKANARHYSSHYQSFAWIGLELAWSIENETLPRRRR
jgi:hypothetical protein